MLAGASLLIGVIWFTTRNSEDSSANYQLPVVAPVQLSERIRLSEFTDLFYASRSLDSLALKGGYTVVEVYLDSCGVCKRLEDNFEPFLQKRDDVVIQRVRFPEYGFTPRVKGLNSLDAAQKRAELTARIESYNMCGTPHIEVYGPDKSLVAKDDCSNKVGLRYLRNWISDEIDVAASSI